MTIFNYAYSLYEICSTTTAIDIGMGCRSGAVILKKVKGDFSSEADAEREMNGPNCNGSRYTIIKEYRKN